MSLNEDNNYEYENPILSSSIKKKLTCHCVKSRCLKLYCDCFANGDCCRPECKCNNCLNI